MAQGQFLSGVFLYLDWLPYQGLRVQSDLPFTDNLEGEYLFQGYWHYVASNLVQDLKLGHLYISYDDKRYTRSASYSSNIGMLLDQVKLGYAFLFFNPQLT